MTPDDPPYGPPDDHPDGHPNDHLDDILGRILQWWGGKDAEPILTESEHFWGVGSRRKTLESSREMSTHGLGSMPHREPAETNKHKKNMICWPKNDKTTFSLKSFSYVSHQYMHWLGSVGRPAPVETYWNPRVKRRFLDCASRAGSVCVGTLVQHE